MRCEQCGQRDATVNLISVTDGSLRQEHLCETCADDRLHARAAPRGGLSLWRGETLLGAIDLATHPLEGWIVGVLVPADGHPPLASIRQERRGQGDDAVVVQAELAMDAMPWPDAPRTDDARAPGLVTMALPDAVPAPVPPERQLQLRFDDGRVWRACVVMLTELRLVDGLTDPFRARAPAAAIHRTTVPGATDRERLWYVVAELDLELRIRHSVPVGRPWTST